MKASKSRADVKQMGTEVKRDDEAENCFHRLVLGKYAALQE